MKNSHLPTEYGSRFCNHCQLTVAEYVNGRLYHSFCELPIYLHDSCSASYQPHHLKGAPHHAAH